MVPKLPQEEEMKVERDEEEKKCCISEENSCLCNKMVFEFKPHAIALIRALVNVYELIAIVRLPGYESK